MSPSDLVGRVAGAGFPHHAVEALRHRMDVRRRCPNLIGNEFKLKKSGNEVYDTAWYLLVIVQHSCSYLHCLKVPDYFFFSCKLCRYAPQVVSPMSSEYGTCKTATPRLWPWLSGDIPYLKLLKLSQAVPSSLGSEDGNRDRKVSGSGAIAYTFGTQVRICGWGLWFGVWGRGFSGGGLGFTLPSGWARFCARTVLGPGRICKDAWNFTRMSFSDHHSGSMRVTTHLDHKSHCKTASGTDWSNRRTYQISIINTRLAWNKSRATELLSWR